jgi:hypothetical protein
MELLIAIVVGLTSLGAYLVGVRGVGLSTAGLATAVVTMMECVGTTVIFALINLGLAAAVIFGVRALTAGFMSVYVLDDGAWWALSVLQGLVWWTWRGTRRSGEESGARSR